MIPSGFSAELVSDLGFDFIIIDCQHGLISYDSMVSMLQATSRTAVAPIVRVNRADAASIGACLDAGAAGVIVPMVNGPADALAAVAACRYPPLGSRSWGPVRSSMILPGDANKVNGDVLCVILIETRDALESIEEIVACPGIDAVFIGTADLALSMGLPIGAPSDDLDVAIVRIREACSAAGVVVGMPVAVERMKVRFEEGYRFFAIGADYQWLRAASTQTLNSARSTLTD